MQIKLNGELYEYRAGGSVADLLVEIGASGKQVAVLVDGEVVPAADRDLTQVTGDATVEIIVMAGGG